MGCAIHADHMGCAVEVYWISSWFYGAMVEDLCFGSRTMVALAALGLVEQQQYLFVAPYSHQICVLGLLNALML